MSLFLELPCFFKQADQLRIISNVVLYLTIIYYYIDLKTHVPQPHLTTV